MKKSKTSYKNKYTNYRGIVLGFEVECLATNLNKLVAAVKAINPETEVGEDGSLDAENLDDADVEIRTQPLPAEKALRELKRILRVVGKHGYTNQSCGLHLNISPSSNKRYYDLNPILFAANPLWDELIAAFNRRDCEYCMNRIPITPDQMPRNVMFRFIDRHLNEAVNNRQHPLRNHYSCVNFENWHIPRTPDSRVEIRGFGNEGYEKRFNDISDFTNRAIKLFIAASNHPCNPIKV